MSRQPGSASTVCAPASLSGGGHRACGAIRSRTPRALPRHFRQSVLRHRGARIRRREIPATVRDAVLARARDCRWRPERPRGGRDRASRGRVVAGRRRSGQGGRQARRVHRVRDAGASMAPSRSGMSSRASQSRSRCPEDGCACTGRHSSARSTVMSRLRSGTTRTPRRSRGRRRALCCSMRRQRRTTPPRWVRIARRRSSTPALSASRAVSHRTPGRAPASRSRTSAT